MQRAVDKNLTAGSPVRDGQFLVGTEEGHRVHAGHSAAPQSVDADFLLSALAHAALAAVN